MNKLLLALLFLPCIASAQFGGGGVRGGFGKDFKSALEAIDEPVTLQVPTTFQEPVKFEKSALFLPTDTPDTHEEGKVFYHDIHFGLEVMTDVDGFTHHLGQSMNVRFRNKTGGTLFMGAVLYQDGSNGNVPTMDNAQANAFPQAEAMGILQGDVNNNGFGWLVAFGFVHNINTNAFAEGDTVYLSQSTPGALTDVKPGSGLVIKVGVILRQHPNQGEIQVHIVNETDLTGGAGTCGTGIDCQGAQSSATICATTCATHPGTLCQVTSSTDFDIYTSTGSLICQFRNTRTGQGPLP